MTRYHSNDLNDWLHDPLVHLWHLVKKQKNSDLFSDFSVLYSLNLLIQLNTGKLPILWIQVLTYNLTDTLNYVYQTIGIYNYVHVVFILRFKKGHTNYELKGHFPLWWILQYLTPSKQYLNINIGLNQYICTYIYIHKSPIILSFMIICC